jgi:hypothetical protein
MRAVCLFVLAVSLVTADAAQGYEYRDLRPDPPTIRVSDFVGRPFNPADLQSGESIRDFNFDVKASICLNGSYTVFIPAWTKLVVHPVKRDGPYTYYQATFLAATSTPIRSEDIPIFYGEPTSVPVPDETPKSTSDQTTVYRSRFDIALRSNLLAMKKQDGKTHNASATLWLTQGFGLTGGYFRSQECDSIIEPLGLHNGERRLIGGLAFRAGDRDTRLDRLAIQLGTTTLPGASALTIGLEANAHLGPTSYELLAYGTRRPDNDAWIRARGDLTLYSKRALDIAVGGQYVNRSFEETVGTERIPIGFRYNNFATGGYVAFATGSQNARFIFTGGAGKGSASEFDYVEFEARFDWRL